jgi:hypothetical protein
MITQITKEKIKHVDNPFESPAILSLCPGILGLERGIERAIGPVRVAAYVEIEAFIVANLVAAMEAGLLAPAPIWTDVKTLNAKVFRKRIHGIIGGYPCQPFSLAGNRGGQMIPDTFGRLYVSTSAQLNLFGASLKTSQGTSAWDMILFTETYELWATQLRQESILRRKLALLIREKDFLSSQLWRTQMSQDFGGSTSEGFSAKLSEQVNWATPDTGLRGSRSTDLVNENGNSCTRRSSGQRRGIDLQTQVKMKWPTPATRDWKDSGNEKSAQERKSPCLPASFLLDFQRIEDRNNMPGKNPGQLNPAWVLQLMGTTLEKTLFVPLAIQLLKTRQK